MRRPVRPIAVRILAVAFLACGPASAGVPEGLEALKRGDYDAAARELRPAAERGDAEAQYRVGLMYEFGKGFAVDKARSRSWLDKAAAQGHVAAMLELGVIYASGDGVTQDDGKAVEWFRKAAVKGNPTAQYNLGLMYAKGSGVGLDNAQAIAWWRKAAEQGEQNAQFKLGVAYENGEGVAKDPVMAYASYAIAARAGHKPSAEYRDDIGKTLDARQLAEARALADGWQVGTPMPARVAAGAPPAGGGAAAARAPDKCVATGAMEGERFTAGHCAVALYGDAHSVAIWFNEDPLTPAEVEAFQTSAYAEDSKGGKRRTLLQIMFCPGGGTGTATPAAVRSIDVNTNHARSPLAGVQQVLDAPADFKVERLEGDLRPGGRLAGRIAATRARTMWTVDFDLTLPMKDAAAGMTCKR